MAHFYGTLQGSKGQATRQGNRHSGISTSCQGWSCGIDVLGNSSMDLDVFSVFLTSGTDNDKNRIMLGTFTRQDLLDPSFKCIIERSK